jgi:hypothetical protein
MANLVVSETESGERFRAREHAERSPPCHCGYPSEKGQDHRRRRAISGDVGNTRAELVGGFRLIGVGRLASNTEIVTSCEVTYTRSCLVGSPHSPARWEGPPEGGVANIWFIAFSPLAELITNGARKGLRPPK